MIFYSRSRGKRVFSRNRLRPRRRNKNIAILAPVLAHESGCAYETLPNKLPIRSHLFGFPARRVNVHAIESSEFRYFQAALFEMSSHVAFSRGTSDS